MTIYVVDTHALIWFLTDDSRLGSAARAAMVSPESRLLFPTMVLSEIKHLSAKGRSPIKLEQVISIIVGVALAQSVSVDGVITRDNAITHSGLVKTIWRCVASTHFRDPRYAGHTVAFPQVDEA